MEEFRIFKSKIDGPLVSVIIPVYNADAYLNKCIKSISTQTYRNLEIILIDDGSTDNSGKLCDDWMKKDSRISVKHKINQGPGIARNIGIENANGDYITFVDSDDWIDPIMYETLVKKAIETGSDIVGCPSIIEFSNGMFKFNFSDLQEGYLDKNQCLVDFLEGDKHSWGAVHNKIYTKKLWEDLRFPAVNHLEDYVVSSKLFNKANKIWFCANPYYHHFCNSTSLSMSGWNKGRLTIPKTTNIIISYLRDNNFDLQVKTATYRFKFLMISDFFWSIYKGRPDNSKELKKAYKKESIITFFDYVVYAKKKKSDVKRVICFLVSLIF